MNIQTQNAYLIACIVPSAVIGVAVWVAFREGQNRWRDTCAKFRTPFYDFLGAMDDRRPHALIDSMKSAQETAILEFTPHISRKNRERFNATVDAYKYHRDNIQAAILVELTAEVLQEFNDDSSPARNLRKSIIDLLKFADYR